MVKTELPMDIATEIKQQTNKSVQGLHISISGDVAIVEGVVTCFYVKQLVISIVKSHNLQIDDRLKVDYSLSPYK